MPRLVCAIHQPNFFPRLTTLRKLYEADVWVVLDNVQFNNRDYQHRARLVVPDEGREQWLTLPVYKPAGKQSRIDELTILEPQKSMRRVEQFIKQCYAQEPHWQLLQGTVQDVLKVMERSASLVDVAEASTVSMLKLLGWEGRVVRSSRLQANQERSARLAELAAAVGADEYLCGTGGATYLDEQPFMERDIAVRYFQAPHFAGRNLSALHAMAKEGWRAFETMATQPKQQTLA